MVRAAAAPDVVFPPLATILESAFGQARLNDRRWRIAAILKVGFPTESPGRLRR